MAEFTKWEYQSVKKNVLLPIIFLIVGIIIFVVMFSIPQRPVEVTRKDAAAVGGEAQGLAPEEEIDWANF